MTSRLLSVMLAVLLTGPWASLAAWHDQVDALDGALTVELASSRAQLAERAKQRAELYELNGPYTHPERSRSGRSEPSTRTYGAAVERWRPLVEAFFHPGDIDWALRVMRCESSGDPDAANPRSSARGLFQHLHRLWPDRAAAAGWPGADIYDPVANVAVAAWLYYRDGPGHWVCR